MSMPEDELVPEMAAVEESQAEGLAQGVEAIAKDAPPPEERLIGARVNAVAQHLETAIRRLTDGEAAVDIADVDGDQEAIPADLFANTMALSQMIDALSQTQIPGLDRYAFDPVEMLTTNKGLRRLEATLATLAKDTELHAELRTAAAPPPAAPAEAMDAAPAGPPSLDGLL